MKPIIVSATLALLVSCSTTPTPTASAPPPTPRTVTVTEVSVPDVCIEALDRAKAFGLTAAEVIQILSEGLGLAAEVTGNPYAAASQMGRLDELNAQMDEKQALLARQVEQYADADRACRDQGGG